ncbi:UNVERIFIED_CONTAM: Store-operated calcium entry-associated regulatory factor [Siphonaria sp. JEL0065]|nr:Store-operated calcium entry-associated regulatory factor [Siphonaria sp. JEL0065]
MTTGRRSSPVKQMRCIGGDACSSASAVIETMQCYNRGFDGSDGNRDVQSKCKAELEDIYRFGSTDVSCEGYAHKNDKYVLAGSCGVEYTLYMTEKGKRYVKEQKEKKKDRYNSREGWYGSFADAARRNNGATPPPRNNGTGGGGGGFGSGFWGGPGFGGGGSGTGGGSGSCSDPPLNSRPQTQSNGPGFEAVLGSEVCWEA